MAGAFLRMITRATGTQKSGLLPRIPTRFETTGRQSGFVESQQDVLAAPISRPIPRTTSNQSAPHNARETAIAREIIHDPGQRARTSFEGHRETVQGQNRLKAGEPPAPSISDPAPPEPLFGLKPLPTEPAELVTEQALTSRNHTPAATTVEPHLPPPVSEVSPPPEPLVAPASISEFEQAKSDVAAPLPLPLHGSNRGISQQNATPAPEISIHIGQLDIRSEEPAPVAPQQTTPATRSLPSLSDYLRGRG